MGCRVIPFFNGELLDVTTAEFKSFGHKWAVISRTGSPYAGGDFSRCNFDIPFKNANNETTSRNMTLHDLCVTGKDAAAWEKGTVRRISQEYGFGNIQLDQIAYKSYLCYDAGHNHASPQQAYTSELMNLLGEIRAELREANPDSVIVGEGYNNLVAQYCDAHWCWGQLESPEIVLYSLPWMLYSHETDALEFGVANRCFVNGVLLDLKIDGGDGYISNYPAFTQHLYKLSSLKKKLKDIYIEGIYRDEEGLAYDKTHAFCAKVYVNRERYCAGVIAANCDDGEVKTTLDVTALSCEAPMAFYLDGREERFPSGGIIELSLPPYEVIAFEFRSVITSK
jgi:hypothetical protein